MTKFLTSAATLALIVASPAAAQLAGGLGGGLGGSVGGAMGGVGGSIGGTASGSINATRSASNAARQADADARRAQRSAERQSARAARNAQADRSFSGNAALSASTASSTMANGMSSTVNGSARYAQPGRTIGNAPAWRSRGTVAADNRGMRSMGSTQRGVPVYYSDGGPRYYSAYPSYDRSYYYANTEYVYVPYDDGPRYVGKQYKEMRRELKGSGATVVQRGPDLVILLPADVTFAFDRAEIQTQFQGSLSAFARTLADYPASDIEIIGHTDAKGTSGYNFDLADRRARNVADFLVAHDVDPSRLVVESVGASEPVASNATPDGRAANRRVEIILHARTS